MNLVIKTIQMTGPWWVSYKGGLIRQVTYKGVTLAQLVKASVGQADVQRFEPHLGHN